MTKEFCCDVRLRSVTAKSYSIILALDQALYLYSVILALTLCYKVMYFKFLLVELSSPQISITAEF